MKHWLKDFRAKTPRERRQQLIDRLDLTKTLATLARESEAMRAAVYLLIAYVLAARALQAPETFGTAARELVLRRMSEVFTVRPTAIAADVSGMMRRLDRDHRAWLRWCEKRAAATGDDADAVRLTP